MLTQWGIIPRLHCTVCDYPRDENPLELRKSGESPNDRSGSFATGTRPATTPAMSAMSLKAEVKSGYWHLPRWAFVG